MLTKDEMAEAVSANDQLADAGQSIPEVLDSLGIDEEDVRYVADQRTTRALAERQGNLDLYRGGRPLRFAMAEVALGSALWIDGFAAGVRASHQLGKDEGETGEGQ